MNTLEMGLLRNPTDADGTTFGEWMINGKHYCYTLEDAIREIPGKHPVEWKVYGQTCIPQGRYEITLEHSPKFGPDTITVNNVVGWTGVRVHAGDNKDNTDGCPILGDVVDGEHIHGGRLRHIVDNLKQIIMAARDGDRRTFLTIVNPIPEELTQ